MNTSKTQIAINGQDVEVVRKDIKNLHLAVYPPLGRIRVAAPLRVSNDAVRLAVISRLGWIKRQQRKFKAQERESAREYVSGESHYFLGHRYRLNVTQRDAPAQVILRNKQVMDLIVRPGSKTAQRQKVLLVWYRKELKALILKLIAKWEPRIGVKVAEWGVKQMKTKWGTCNPKVRRIWLNLELAKKPVQCLEYIVVHEMVHFLERHHNERFKAIMDKVMPQWKREKALLNQYPLMNENWVY